MNKQKTLVPTPTVDPARRKPGRPVVENSLHHLKMMQYEALRAAGRLRQRGRPPLNASATHRLEIINLRLDEVEKIKKVLGIDNSRVINA